MTTDYLEKMLDPWREFDHMTRSFNRLTNHSGNQYPAVNVWVNGEDAVITAELPGLDRESIDLTVSGNKVTLSGSRAADTNEGAGSCHRHELRYGTFSKTIQLPFNIDPDRVKAVYAKGVLRLTLPQLEADKPRKISITS